MNTKLKKNRLLFSVTGIVATVFVVLIAFILPSSVYTFEDRRLEKMDKHYTSEAVSINSKKISLVEKLKGAGDVIGGYHMITLFDNGTIKSDMDTEAAIDKGFRYFYDLLAPDFLSEEYADVSFDEFKNSYDDWGLGYHADKLLLFDESKNYTYYGWRCVFYITETEVLDIYVDDETGSLLSIWLTYNDYCEFDMEKVGERLAKIYGYNYIDQTGYVDAEDNLMLYDIRMDTGDGEIVMSVSLENPIIDTGDSYVFSLNSYSEIDLQLMRNGN